MTPKALYPPDSLSLFFPLKDAQVALNKIIRLSSTGHQHFSQWKVFCSPNSHVTQSIFETWINNTYLLSLSRAYFKSTTRQTSVNPHFILILTGAYWVQIILIPQFVIITTFAINSANVTRCWQRMCRCRKGLCPQLLAIELKQLD